jgi:hypothetical protein
MMTAARMKNGSARSTKLLIPLMVVCANVMIGMVPDPTKKASPPRSRAKPTGSPMNKDNKKGITTKKTAFSPKNHGCQVSLVSAKPTTTALTPPPRPRTNGQE